jgi:3-phenylpropionate/trans-cinnamate dioxygenase ferredoxin subunit
MTALKITPIDDGPYMVEGDAQVVDPLGNEYVLRGEAAVFLCRCGGSATKPFCDRTHERVEFKNAARATVDLVAAPTLTQSR